MLTSEGDVACCKPFMVWLLSGGGCRLLVVRETFEVTDAASVAAFLPFRLKSPMLAAERCSAQSVEMWGLRRC